MLRRIALVAAGIGLLAALAPSGSPALSAKPAEPATPEAPAASVAAPTVHWTDAEALGVMPAATTTATYRFSTYYNSKPVRWNPCQVIRWKFRTTGAPTGGLTVVKSAIARVAYLTGTNWVYDGTTTTVPSSRWLPTSTTTIRPVLIGWTSGYWSDLLAGQPASVLGVTRSAYFRSTVNGVPVAATKAGVIALDYTNKLPLTGAISWRSTMLHELAHLMGLDHVGTTSQMMYPVLSRSLTDLQSGDRTGLYKLGRSAGCVNIGF